MATKLTKNQFIAQFIPGESYNEYNPDYDRTKKIIVEKIRNNVLFYRCENSDIIHPLDMDYGNNTFRFEDNALLWFKYGFINYKYTLADQ